MRGCTALVLGFRVAKQPQTLLLAQPGDLDLYRIRLYCHRVRV